MAEYEVCELAASDISLQIYPSLMIAKKERIPQNREIRFFDGRKGNYLPTVPKI